MPPSCFRSKLARAQRRDGGFRFKHYTYDSSLSSDENLINLSEFIEILIGEDDWCGQDIEDKNVVDLTDDEILREIDCNEDNSIEKILDRWRKSVSRQEDSFSRRGDSERNKDNENEDNDNILSNDIELLTTALNTIEDDANFAVPLSHKADHKMNTMPKFEFIQRLSIKSYLNYRVKHSYGKMDASIATAAAILSGQN